MQKTGHKLARFLQARFGPDTTPAPDAIQVGPPVPAEVQPGR
jgi:hypothetical protein